MGEPPVRGNSYPAFVTNTDDGYKLSIPVPGSPVGIKPPQSIVEEDTEEWPSWSFQLLMVASEYCAALFEFITWSFPDDWNALRKAEVAGYARVFIRTSAAVAPLDVPPSGDVAASWQSRNAHSVWAVFTHCYFHGVLPPAETNAPEEEQEEWDRATAWLNRLVGEYGWRRQEPNRPNHSNRSVYQAATTWVNATLPHLLRFFPNILQMQAKDWATAGLGGVGRAVWSHGRLESMAAYRPLFPPNISTEKDGRSRLKFTVNEVTYRPEIKGCCSMPGGFTQRNRCVLSYMIAVDVTNAFCKAFEEAFLPLQPAQFDLREEVVEAFIRTVLESDGTDLTDGHDQYGYPSYLASCALGWRLALQQLPLWLEAAAGCVAAVAAAAEVPLDVISASGLLMPRDLLAAAH